MANTPDTDGIVTRLEALLAQATDAVRRGKGDTALLLMQEALATAERLPSAKSALPALTKLPKLRNKS